MRRYYLHKRKGIFYAELVTPEGHKLTAKSTGKATEDEALLVVSKWLAEGIPSGRERKARSVESVIGLSGILKAIRKSDLDGNDAMKIVNALKGLGLIDISATKAGQGSIPFSEFLETFWDYYASPYVKEKLAHKQSITKRHCYDMGNRIRRYWQPTFKDRTLISITRQDLKDFSLALSEKGLAPASINKIMIGGNTALSWAFREGHIPLDPTEGIMRFSGTSRKRGVLTPEEAEEVFKIEWKDKRTYAGNLLSLTTGLRSGEVLALRKSDIGDKILYVNHSWSTMDGLKSPKNGEARKVPLLPEVRNRIMELLAENPHKVDDPFIFYGSLENKPMDQKILVDGLKMACKEVGIDTEARGIVFHSHRHFYAARLADKMTAEQISRITGHKSRAVFDSYADHVIDENIEAMAEAAAESFGKILQFRKGA